MLSGIVLLFIFGAVYFTPTMIAANRKNINTPSIFVLNLLLGWSFIGWVIALIWAFKK